MTEEEILDVALDSAVEDIIRENGNPPTTRTGREKKWPFDIVGILPKEYVPLPASASKKDLEADLVHKKRLDRKSVV